MVFLKHLYKDLEDYLFSKDKINEILQIFTDCYGEDRVDIQLTISPEDFYSCLSCTQHANLVCGGFRNLLMDCSKDVIKDLIIKYKGNKTTYINRFISINHVNVYILIYFPKITVTNEYDESIDIEEVYIRVPINTCGKMISSFEIVRTKYSYDQYVSGYMHSHAYTGIDKTSRDWRSMCLGIGPLVTTTHTLKNSYDLDIWRLFCIELDEYLKVESVAGVPYIRMNRIGDNSRLSVYAVKCNENYCNDIQYKITCFSYFFKDFLKFFIWKLCNREDYFTFKDNNICLAISNEQFAIITSKYFIEYCNYRKLDIDLNIIISDYMVLAQRDVSGVLRYNTRTNSSNHNNGSSSSTKVLTFKGQDKYVNIDVRMNNNNKEIYLLKPVIVSQILNYVLKIVNYGNTKEFTTDSKIPYFF